MIKPGAKAWAVFSPRDLTDARNGNLIQVTVKNVERKTMICEYGEKIEYRYEVNFGLESAWIYEGSVFYLNDRDSAEEKALALADADIDRLRRDLERVEACKRNVTHNAYSAS